MPIEVKGHSGCEIEVVREDSQLFILKSSRDPKYLSRLIRQANKQIAASELELQHIKVPKIRALYESDSEVIVKMDYIYSRNFVEFFEHAGFEQVNYLIDALIKFLEYEISNSEMTLVESSVVSKKFADVCFKIAENPHLKGYPEIEKILHQSAVIFKDLPDMLIPIGECHGDLTFSNILFNGNNYYLIDFLDSFIESPLLDIVKIRQDTAWLWSRLMYVGECDSLRLKIAFTKIDEALNHHFLKNYEWYGAYYTPLQIMNFLRILQYAHEKVVIEYLINVLSRQINNGN